MRDISGMCVVVVCLLGHADVKCYYQVFTQLQYVVPWFIFSVMFVMDAISDHIVDASISYIVGVVTAVYVEKNVSWCLPSWSWRGFYILQDHD